MSSVASPIARMRPREIGSSLVCFGAIVLSPLRRRLSWRRRRSADSALVCLECILDRFHGAFSLVVVVAFDTASFTRNCIRNREQRLATISLFSGRRSNGSHGCTKRFG